MSTTLEHLPHRRVLVTGAAGFIGARVSQFLLDIGCEVIGLDNLNDYYSVPLKQERLRELQLSQRFRFVRCDLLEREKLNSFLEQESEVDAVIHLAAQAGVRYSFAEPLAFVRSNVIGCYHLLEAATRNGVAKFVLASTSTLYANAEPPFSESDAVGPPPSPYAESKKVAESLAHDFHDRFGLDVSILRYFTVYGPAGRPDMAYFRFMQAIDQETPITLFGDGNQARDFTYVDDIAAGTLAALQPTGFEIFNLGSGKDPVSIKGLVTALAELMGKSPIIHRLPPHAGDMFVTRADTTKAKTWLNWQASTDLGAGLLAAVEWYQNNRSWTSQITHK